MINPELGNYIRDSRAMGVGDEQIKQTLLSQGWNEADVLASISNPDGIPLAASETKTPLWKNKKIIIGVIVILLVLVAGGAAAYLFTPPKPEVVVAHMLEKMRTVNKISYQGSFQGNVSAPNVLSTALANSPDLKSIASGSSGQVAGITNSALKFDFSGSTDFSNPASPNSANAFTISFQNFSASMEARLIGANVFVRLTQATTFGLFDLSKIKNVWIKSDRSEFANPTADSSASNLTAGQTKQIEDLYAQIKPIQITKKLPDDEINSTSVYSFNYHINKDALNRLVSGSYNIIYGHPMPNDQQLSLLQGVNFNDGQMWIGKKDNYLYKMNGGFALNFGSTTPVSGQIDWEINLSNFNEPVNIETPTDAKSTEEIQGLLMGQAEGTARDARRIADIRQIQTGLELYSYDHGKYPTALTSLSPTYLPTIPKAPEPADGSCTIQQNTYTYAKTASGYNLTFCLGGAAGSLTAGVHTASERGLQ